MADPKEGFLDDIGEETQAAAADATDQVAAPETGEADQDDAERAQSDGKPQRKPDTRPDGYVSKAERDRIYGELQQERQGKAALEQRFNAFIDRYFKQQEQPAAREAEEGPPDETQDPLGALAWTKRQLQQMQDAQRQQSQQSEQQQTAQRQWQEAYGAVQGHFAQKVAEKPELQSLYDGLRHSYAREYSALNPGIAPMQVMQMVERQEAQIIQWAYQNRYPIDAVIEQLASSRGVQAKAAEQKPAPQRDPETGQFTSAEVEKAAKTRESQERNASLSSAPGASVKQMTAKELAAMPEDEMWRYFDNAGRKPGAREFDRRMGFRP